ncbi:hypothetical protein ACIGW8_31010 [Streptomyces sioyaensis]|uniref:hypothetical protein n=1 Tax=Streptomyces sioyaensis TaxID=67364 RepID=UPI0037D8FFE2
MIEYRVDGQPDIIRLITSLTDHEKYPATELAALYARRGDLTERLSPLRPQTGPVPRTRRDRPQSVTPPPAP